ncbi:Smr/MutS family protein [Brucepastera parasyntrophica]|uniref:Smr/MutS family protein n=1 Tax=Brucepastera parasyntrophica TaxID=2880008 RepID=UPI00210EB3F4|nr:Smr/MutS family protein [Brucepastera parasyntrophica]ULQ60698.1 Smr/MutS family protein [Brucepastera parasyntrophica]
MNFGDILDEWEKIPASAKVKKTTALQDESTENAYGQKELPHANPMDVWMRRYGIQDKDALLEKEREQENSSGNKNYNAERRKKLRAMKPEAVIDLHGLNREEAWIKLDVFFADSVRQGLSKILIVHGKGNHSDENPVLGKTVREFIEKNPHAGESGTGAKEQGAAGSTWVILK